MSFLGIIFLRKRINKGIFWATKKGWAKDFRILNWPIFPCVPIGMYLKTSINKGVTSFTNGVPSGVEGYAKEGNL